MTALAPNLGSKGHFASERSGPPARASLRRMNESSRLHFSLIERSGQAQRTLLFVHGILGSGANLRGIATRLVEADPSWAAALVDLRGHGRSPVLSAPHSVAACAADLTALERTLPHPVQGVVGHSFGGKVALAYHRERPDLQRVAILDSAPFARPERTGSEQTMAVIGMLEAAPGQFATREAFSQLVTTHGHSRTIADWLAMNLVRSNGGFRLRTELAQIRALLDDYFSAELWPVLEGGHSALEIVIGGQSNVWGAAEIERARALSDSSHGRVRVHVLPNAGHWVHTDDADGVVVALQRERQRRKQ